MTSYDKNPAVPAAGKLMHGYAALCKELQKKIWIITEADRSYTTVMLPQEY